MAFAAVYFVWGSTYLAIKITIETLPPLLTASARFTTAGAVLYGVARLRGTPRPSPHEWRTAAIVGGCLLLGGNGAIVWAEQYIASSVAALLVATVPLWIVLLERPAGLSTERPGPRTLTGVGIGMGGLVLLLGPGESPGDPIDPAGAGALIAGSLSWAVGSLYSRRAQHHCPPFLFAGMQMVIGGALLFAAGAASGELGRFDPAAASTRSLLALAYLTTFGALVAYTAYVWLLQVSTPARVSTYAYINPVIAVLLGGLIASEPITPHVAISASIIVTAVVFINRQRASATPRH